MKNMRISLYLLLFIILVATGNSQEIRRDELRSFMGIVEVITTPKSMPPNKPPLYHLTLTSDQFLDYKIHSTVDSLRNFQNAQPPRSHKFKQAFMLPNYLSDKFMLEIPELDLLITSLNNFGWEGSFNILAFWNVHGNNLSLNWINKEVFRAGLGNVEILPDYVVLPDTSIAFILNPRGSDFDFFYRTYILLRLDYDQKSLDQLSVKSSGGDMDREIQSKIDYKFLTIENRPKVRFVERQYKWVFEDGNRLKMIDSVIVSQDTSYIDLLEPAKKDH